MGENKKTYLETLQHKISKCQGKKMIHKISKEDKTGHRKFGNHNGSGGLHSNRGSWKTMIKCLEILRKKFFSQSVNKYLLNANHVSGANIDTGKQQAKGKKKKLNMPTTMPLAHKCGKKTEENTNKLILCAEWR